MTYTMPLSEGGTISSDAPISAVHVAAAQTYSVIIEGIEYRSSEPLHITEGTLDDQSWACPDRSLGRDKDKEVDLNEDPDYEGNFEHESNGEGRAA